MFFVVSSSEFWRDLMYYIMIDEAQSLAKVDNIYIYAVLYGTDTSSSLRYNCYLIVATDENVIGRLGLEYNGILPLLKIIFYYPSLTLTYTGMKNFV